MPTQPHPLEVQAAPQGAAFFVFTLIALTGFIAPRSRPRKPLPWLFSEKFARPPRLKIFVAEAVMQTRGVLAYFRRQGVESDSDRETNEARGNLRKWRTIDQDSLRRIHGEAIDVTVMKMLEFEHMMLSGIDAVYTLAKGPKHALGLPIFLASQAPIR